MQCMAFFFLHNFNDIFLTFISFVSFVGFYKIAEMFLI